MGDTLVPGDGNGYLLTPKTGVEAETNQYPKTDRRRQNAPVRLSDHTARRSCSKHSETIWDSELPGFGLRLRPPNGKSWVVFYRERGVQRTISLGPVNKVSAEEARRNMERPGLKALLADIEAGLVDVIVVYKVDRLTRSLADFAKIVERLDAKDASFVSSHYRARGWATVRYRS